MKISRVRSTAVSTTIAVEISIDTQQAEELRRALAVVDKYRKQAIQAVHHYEKHHPVRDADFCEIEYGVKNDKVVITVKSGMAG